MRIVHISDCYLPRLGGIEMQVAQLATRQVQAGHEVHVITATPGHDAVRSGVEVLDGVTVHRVAARLPMELPVHPRTGHHVTTIVTELLRESTARALVAHVHAGVISPFAWSGMRATASLSVPTVVTVHSIWGPMAQPGFRAANGLVHWSGGRVQLAAVSEVAADRIRTVVGNATSVVVTPNGVDPDRWRVTAVPHSDNDVHVVAVMRLAPRKRALPLLGILRSAGEALPAGIRLHGTVVGDGPERGRVEKYIREHSLDVDLPGRLTHEQIRELYASADMFVQPSVKESFGLAALEARTAGLPIVARSETGITEFVREGVEGLLVGSDEEMAGAVVRLAADPALRHRIAEHNRTIEPVQTWPGVLAAVDEAYARAAERVVR